MKQSHSVARLLAAIALACSAGAQAAYSNLFVFGDSLSDSGNNYLLLGGVTTPVSDITGNSFIPTYPYASGNYTNGATWAQTFAASTGLGSVPSLAPGGTNYAFGGARTSFPAYPTPGYTPSLTQQAGMFLTAHAGAAPSSALYVVAGGGNNARDALEAIAGGADAVATITATATAYATDIGHIVGELKLAGAQHIIVWDTPDLGKGPAILAQGAGAAALGTSIATAMNGALAFALNGTGVQTFDLFGWMNVWVANPGLYGLSNVVDACGALGALCNPSEYLFWDGIHPTSAGHALIADRMYALAVPEPATYGMLLVGLALVAGVARRRSARASARERAYFDGQSQPLSNTIRQTFGASSRQIDV